MNNSNIKRIAVTGAGGHIAYSLLFRLANGDLFGKDQPIALHLLEVPDAVPALQGVKMELEDCAFPLLHEIHYGSDPYAIFEDIDIAFLVGAKPRGPGMERKDLLSENGKIFIEQGKALNISAKKSVKVLVVGNPCNTNCLITSHNAPDISKNNFFAMTRLDENRAKAQLALKARVEVKKVTCMAIWGNHSSTQVPDFENAKINKELVPHVIKDRKWLEQTFIQIIQKRGAQIIEARGKSSAASAAHAAIESMKSLFTPTPNGEFFSLGVCSDGNPYGIEDDLIFSFPCRSKGDGNFEIVKNISWSPFIQDRIQETEKELKEEKEMVLSLI